MTKRFIRKSNTKISLVFPPPDSGHYGIGRVYPSALPPTGLAILASTVHAACPEAVVNIIDGSGMKLEKIYEMISGDIIGISNWSVCQHNALRIAAWAKDRFPRSLILMGGPNASHLAERIIRNHNCVDAVICDDGETSLSSILLGTPFSEIPNLVYMDDDKVIETPLATNSITDVPFFDFEDLHPRFESKDNIPVPISAIRGCIEATRSGACSYCSIRNNHLRITPPERVWQQIALLQDYYNISYVFETGDNFIVGNYPEQLLKSRPSSLRTIAWRIYTYPEAMTSHTMGILQKLNVRTVFLGVETITPKALTLANRKGYQKSTITNIVQQAREFGFKLILSFIFGLPGETVRTTLKNREFIEEIVAHNKDVFEAVCVSIATPVIGSKLFLNCVNDSDLCKSYQEKTGQNLAQTDIFDYSLLCSLYIDKHTDINYAWLVSQINGCKAFIQGNDIIPSNFLGVEREITF